MPIYEYRCQDCNAVFEKLVRGGKEPTACPTCDSASFQRLISKAGIIFKGSGFYVNDSKGSSSSATTGGSSDSGSDKKSESTSNSDSSSSSESSGSSSKSESSSNSGSSD